MGPRKTVLVIGGAGAQGLPVVKALTQDPQYAVRVLTRDAKSINAKKLTSLRNVTFALGSSDDETALRAAFKGVDLAFVNLNGFALGIKSEAYWGIRIFEIAAQSGVKQYIWSSLDNAYRDSGYDEAVRCGHYDGKARVADWMASQPQTPMQWSILTTGPSLEALSDFLRPTRDEAGTHVFRLPLADGAVPFIHLDDIGGYVRWLLAHPAEAVGMNLKVATEHVSGAYLAETFTAVTGKPACYEPVSIDDYFEVGARAYAKHQKLGAQTAGPYDDTLMTFKQNFSAWWTIYQRSGGNDGLITRDYDQLDHILPGRVKSLGEWMERTGYTGGLLSVVNGHYHRGARA